jgi:hypothetical protein
MAKALSYLQPTTNKNEKNSTSKYLDPKTITAQVENQLICFISLKSQHPSRELHTTRIVTTDPPPHPQAQARS